MSEKCVKCGKVCGFYESTDDYGFCLSCATARHEAVEYALRSLLIELGDANNADEAKAIIAMAKKALKHD